MGKAIKTIFLCRYLRDEALRREINDGLNVIEHWNSANDFVFFARRGELGSNRREDQEVSMLSLHLLQNCMVFVNTLMLQQVLARPHWADLLTSRDQQAVTPLIWDHVNPYGRFELDMDSRIPVLACPQMAADDTTVGNRPIISSPTTIRFGRGAAITVANASRSRVSAPAATSHSRIELS